eukprot:m.71135 g.71135  ORF g.71135 m.71135 type:complete len:172 (+) comp14136_c0_seq3:58-573(+)
MTGWKNNAHADAPVITDRQATPSSVLRVVNAALCHFTLPAAEAENAPAGDGAKEVVVEKGLKVLTDDTFEAGVATGITLVKFYAPWCGHCKRLAPVWDELAAKFESDAEISVGKVDCTQHSTTCGNFQVRGYPTLLLFKDGRQMDKYSGARELAALTKFLFKAAGRPHDEL